MQAKISFWHTLPSAKILEIKIFQFPKYQVIGGLTDKCLSVADTLYSQIISETVKVSSPETAEATKLMENIFRAVNIAMVNELKLVFERMNINIWEVIEAANSKPFGFMPFYQVWNGRTLYSN